MENKYKALLNYIVGTTMMFIIVIVCSALFINDTVGTIGNNLSQPQADGVTFLISIIAMGITYTVVTLVFAEKEKIANSVLPIILSAIAAAAIITLIESSYYALIYANKKLWVLIIIMVVLTPVFICLVLLFHIYITKSMLSVVIGNRADEWEVENFTFLIKTKSKIEHLDGHSILTYKGDKFALKFMPDDVVERKIIVAGENRELFIKTFETRIDNCKAAALVYLSNSIPGVIGENEKIKVIRNSDLEKFIKGEL